MTQCRPTMRLPYVTKMLVLAKKQEVLAELIFRQRGRVTLKVLGQFAHVADVFFFSGRPEVFQLDKGLELFDRGIVENFRSAASRKLSPLPCKGVFGCPFLIGGLSRRAAKPMVQPCTSSETSTTTNPTSK